MKTKMLRVRFDDDQWEELQRLAQESGLSMSGSSQQRYRFNHSKNLKSLVHNRLN